MANNYDSCDDSNNYHYDDDDDDSPENFGNRDFNDNDQKIKIK